VPSQRAGQRRRQHTGSRSQSPLSRQRRALTHVGGKIEVVGPAECSNSVLADALRVSADEATVMAHVHGFHSYPARLHPQTAARLVRALSPAGGRLLDPFCGSGTVLVEARLLGRVGVGVDVNPLAAAGAQVVEHAEARRRARVGPAQRYGRLDRQLFEPHVLLELDGLRHGIEALPGTAERRALRLVLSAMLTKFSSQLGDTSRRRGARRLAGGQAIRFFARKLGELIRRLSEFARLLPARAPAAQLSLGDARDLRHLESDSVDLVLSSPPYPGVYDYVDHHATRLRWLGLGTRGLQRQEIGSRRQLSALTGAAALRTWERDLGRCLAEMARVLRPDGAVVLIMADSVLGGQALRADELVERTARAARLRVGAKAAQNRPHFYPPATAAFAQGPRREWVLVLGHTPPARRRSRRLRMDRRAASG
jgi:SAM-dependent methyltransferase